MVDETSGIHPAPVDFNAAQIATDPILHFFHYQHLPPQLRDTSRLFAHLAYKLVTTLPRNAERTVALRKLLEAKDAAVRANLPPPLTVSLWICPVHGLHHGPICCDQKQEYWDGTFITENHDMDKETSSRVSTIAADILRREPAIRTDAATAAYNSLLADAKTLAGSCLSQDETPGQQPGTVIDRLKLEHAHLSGKRDALALFLGRGVGVSNHQKALLDIQFSAMTLYLQVLEMRLHTPTPKPLVASKPELGDVKETGGHDQDRDGPVSFGG